MISRLTAIATTVALLATATLAVAASAHQNAATALSATASTSVKPTRVVQLPTVIVVAKRNAQAI